MKTRKNTSPRTRSRRLRKIRIRKHIQGTSVRPRLCVFRSHRHIYAQIVDDEKGLTLAAASTVEKTFSAKDAEKEASGRKQQEARKVGELLAERALAQSVKQVRFDRGGYGYHGRVLALAEGAREKGLMF